MPLRDDLAVLLIDVQESFVAGAGARGPAAMARIERLCRLARFAGLPVAVTLERPAAEKGALPARVEDALPDGTVRFEKGHFDALAEPGVRAGLDALGRGAVAVAGAETDVCVLFTTLSLLRVGYRVYVVEDACFSSDPAPDAARHRMRAAGAVPCTVKTLAHELTGVVESEWPDEWRENRSLFPEDEA